TYKSPPRAADIGVPKIRDDQENPYVRLHAGLALNQLDREDVRKNLQALKEQETDPVIYKKIDAFLASDDPD
ncbi:MAG: hypothetical protein N2C14_02555, partial [Planctomycetales bacterium]